MGWSPSGNNFEAFRIFLSAFFWQQNMKKCSFSVSKNKWELYQNLKFLMEVVLSGMETVGDLGNPKKCICQRNNFLNMPGNVNVLFLQLDLQLRPIYGIIGCVMTYVKSVQLGRTKTCLFQDLFVGCKAVSGAWGPTRAESLWQRWETWRLRTQAVCKGVCPDWDFCPC